VRTLSTRQVSITAAALLLATLAWTSVQAAGADARSGAPAAGEAGKSGAHGGDVYGVVNLIAATLSRVRESGNVVGRRLVSDLVTVPPNLRKAT